MIIKLITNIKNEFLKLRAFLIYSLLVLVTNHYIEKSLMPRPINEIENYTNIISSLSCVSLFMLNVVFSLMALYSLYTYLVSRH